jgi:hypothetical protein
MLTTDSPDLVPPALLWFGGVALIVLWVLRWARLNAEAGGATPPGAMPARRPLWGPARKLEKLHETTAIVRAEADLYATTIDQVQARHNLHRLQAQLAPPPPGRTPAESAAASLTLPEVRAVLASIDMPRELRAVLLELIEAAINEKVQS